MTTTSGGQRTIVVHLADQRRDRTDSHGIINFSLGLVAALPTALAPTWRLVVLANESIASEIDRSEFRPTDLVRSVAAPAIGATPGRMWLDHVRVGRHAAAAAADVVLYPKGFLPARPRPVGARHVVVFHDDIASRRWRDPAIGWRARPRAGYFHLLARRSLAGADRRLFVSEFSAQQLTGAAGARADDAVVGQGLRAHRRPHVPIADRAPQVLVFGSSLAHKRIDPGLAVLIPLLPPELRKIVVVGDAPTLPPGLTAQVDIDVRPGARSAAEVADLLATSRLLFFPSDYEGFGLPPIEAHASGTPALYRGNGAAREVLGDRPGRFDIEEPASMAAALHRALGLDDDALQAMASEMAIRFDWRQVATSVAASVGAGQTP